jgi:hypothetical protein
MAERAPAQPAGAEVLTTQEKGLLDQIVEQGRFGTDNTARERGKNLVRSSWPRSLKVP